MHDRAVSAPCRAEPGTVSAVLVVPQIPGAAAGSPHGPMRALEACVRHAAGWGPPVCRGADAATATKSRSRGDRRAGGMQWQYSAA